MNHGAKSYIIAKDKKRSKQELIRIMKALIIQIS